MSISNNIKKIMTKKNITIDALSKKTNLSVGTIKRARTDQIIDCRFSTLITIADALDVQVKDLFDELPTKDKKDSLQMPEEQPIEEIRYGSNDKNKLQFPGMERAMKHFQEEQEERIRNLMEESITKHVREFERKLRENQQEVLKKAGLPPIDSIF